jgi:CubicO group peptidase (beta-lactamase class C family)
MRKLLFLYFFPLLANAQKNSKSALDQYMNAQVKEFQFSGDVLVAQKGKIIYKKAFGIADREWGIPNTVETKFKIGSITKQFTAVAILQLAQTGRLSLDDKLSKFFHDFPKGDSVTIHMMLNHTSGIRDYFQALNAQDYRDLTLVLSSRSRQKDSMVAFFKTVGYVFPPGTNFHYSNTAYLLLGYIIEQVTGQAFGAYLAQHVFSKAMMVNTCLDEADSILLQRAKGYDRTISGWRNADYLPNELAFSAGAIISTIDDQYKWTKALHQGKIVAPSLFAKMTTPYLNNYGYGLNILFLDGHKYIGHNGGFPGFNNQSDYYPDEALYVVILSNNGSNAATISRGLAGIMLGLQVDLPYKHKAATIDSKLLDKYVGKYLTSTNTIELVSINGKFFRRQQGAKDLELIPESNVKFFYSDGSDRQFSFILDAKGEVQSVQLIKGGIVENIKKIE